MATASEFANTKFVYVKADDSLAIERAGDMTDVTQPNNDGAKYTLPGDTFVYRLAIRPDDASSTYLSLRVHPSGALLIHGKGKTYRAFGPHAWSSAEPAIAL